MRSCALKTNDFDKWISSINDVCGPFLARQLSDEFVGSVEKVGGSLDMSRVLIQGADLYRTPKEISGDGVPVFFCAFQISGHSVFEQAGKRSSVSAGDIVLIDSTLPFRFSYLEPVQQISLIVPRQVIERVLNVDRIELGVKIPAGSHIARFARKLVLEASLHQNLGMEESDAILYSVAALIKSPVLKSVQGLDPNEKVFMAAAEFIKGNIGDPELNASLVAKSVGTSVRNLYRVFSCKSITPSEYVKLQRLEMSADYMKSHSGSLSLTEVAYRYGFGSPSYFSTAFKGHYGVKPSDFLKKAHHI